MADVVYNVKSSNWNKTDTVSLDVGERLYFSPDFGEKGGDDAWGLYTSSYQNLPPNIEFETWTIVRIEKGDKKIYSAFGYPSKPGTYYVTKSHNEIKDVFFYIKGNLKKGAKTTIKVYGNFKAGLAYDATGGTGAPATQYASGRYLEKYHIFSFTIPNTKPTRNGYAFQGWATYAGGPVVYQPGNVDTVAGSYAGTHVVTLYAAWQILTWYLRLNYNANGGTGAPASYYTATPRETGTTVSITIPNTVPTRTGYMFKGWSKNAASSTAEYQPGDTIQLAETTKANSANNLYAVWDNSYYSVLHYDANGGTGAPEDDVMTTNAESKPGDAVHTIKSGIPILNKYKFKGWSTVKYEIGKGTPEYNVGDSILVPYYNIATPTTLYAVWKRKCSIYVKVNGVWEEAQAYVKDNGTWKEVEEVYAKLNDEWRQ